MNLLGLTLAVIGPTYPSPASSNLTVRIAPSEARISVTVIFAVAFGLILFTTVPLPVPNTSTIGGLINSPPTFL